jgi:hypothetical protein
MRFATSRSTRLCAVAVAIISFAHLGLSPRSPFRWPFRRALESAIGRDASFEVEGTFLEGFQLVCFAYAAWLLYRATLEHRAALRRLRDAAFVGLGMLTFVPMLPIRQRALPFSFRSLVSWAILGAGFGTFHFLRWNGNLSRSELSPAERAAALLERRWKVLFFSAFCSILALCNMFHVYWPSKHRGLWIDLALVSSGTTFMLTQLALERRGS